MKRLLPLLLLLATAANGAGPISRPGDRGPFLATRGGAAIPTGGSAPAAPAARTPAPAPGAGPHGAPPRAIVFPQPPVGPVPPYAPRVTSWTTDSHGRVNGYRVSAPAVDVNPFSGLPIATAPAAPPPVERVVTERVYPIPEPDAAEADAAEAQALARKLGDGAPAVRAVDDERFRTDVLPAVLAGYRFDGTSLVPAYAYEVSGASVRRTALPDAAPLPPPTAEQVRAAFVAGATFLVPRKASFTVPCGACAGTGRVAVQRIVRDDGAPDRIAYAACRRCGGHGTRKAEATRLFEVSRKAD